MSFESIERGTYSGIKEARTELFRSADAFRTFWGKHGSSTNPPPSLPVVDFDTEMVAVVHRGDFGSGGYGVEVKSVEADGEDVVIKYKSSNPPQGAMVTMAFTQPFHVVKIPARAGQARFEEIVAAADEVGEF
eukprot:CAMPEP_0194280102 /NCGR_PEP_ID=MMETSP0169-20130528/15910_1 /TAXON_ID=218684 /ORGANISM="Corethron pennatum, Strain L29A3" /LENGTH=132 /DNA_ID=CAMNT_0039024701 /DNA_START=191 /DNA_END=589 /DNA_ORIENTATION=-